jgi:hypothetical protein
MLRPQWAEIEKLSVFFRWLSYFKFNTLLTFILKHHRARIKSWSYGVKTDFYFHVYWKKLNIDLKNRKIFQDSFSTILSNYIKMMLAKNWKFDIWTKKNSKNSFGLFPMGEYALNKFADFLNFFRFFKSIFNFFQYTWK